MVTPNRVRNNRIGLSVTAPEDPLFVRTSGDRADTNRQETKQSQQQSIHRERKRIYNVAMSTAVQQAIGRATMYAVRCALCNAYTRRVLCVRATAYCLCLFIRKMQCPMGHTICMCSTWYPLWCAAPDMLLRGRLFQSVHTQ